jgi:hypothetical protein
MHRAVEILIEQYVTAMWPTQIVDDENPLRGRSDLVFPFLSQSIVIHDEPLGMKLIVDAARLRGILAPVNVNLRAFAARQCPYSMTSHADEIEQMTGVPAAYEVTPRTPVSQSVGKSQAAHDMAGADSD